MNSAKLVIIMVLIIGIIAILMLPVLLRFRLSIKQDPAGKQWLLFRKKLADAGVPSSASMTPSELQLVACIELQEEEQAIDHISQLYQDIKYAPQGPAVHSLMTAVKNFQPRKKAARRTA